MATIKLLEGGDLLTGTFSSYVNNIFTFTSVTAGDGISLATHPQHKKWKDSGGTYGITGSTLVIPDGQVESVT